MSCYCGKDQTDTAKTVKCKVCNVEVHRSCYGLADTDKIFYCELCLLFLAEPLVGTVTSIVEKTYEYQAAGIESVSFELSEKQIAELKNHRHFLNVFIASHGKINEEEEELDMLINGYSYRIMTKRYNLIKWASKFVVKKFNRKDGAMEKFNISLPFNRFEGLRTIYVNISNLLEKNKIYQNVFSRNTSKMQDTSHFSCLKSILEQSKTSVITTTIPLVCPLTLSPMQHPGKGLRCSHLAFFCTKNYIDMNLANSRSESRWRCPICKERIFYIELFVDDLMTDVINKYLPPCLKPSIEDERSEEEDDKGTSNTDLKKKDGELKVHVHEGKIYSASEFETIIHAMQNKNKSANLTTANRHSFDQPKSLGDSKLVNVLMNPNHDSQTERKEFYLEITQSDISMNDSRLSLQQNKIPPPYETPKRAISSQAPILSGKSSIKIAFQKEKKERIEDEVKLLAPKSANMIVEENMIQDMPDSMPHQEVPDKPRENPKFKKITSELYDDHMKAPFVKNLRIYPNQDLWLKKIVEVYPNILSFLPSILEYPESLRWIVDQIFLIATELKKTVVPDMDKFFIYSWMIALKLEPQCMPKKAGEICGWFCQSHQNCDEVVVVMLNCLKDRGCIGPMRLENFDSDGDKVEEIAERLAQFVFGWALGMSLPNNDKGTPSSCGTAFFVLFKNSVFLLDKVFTLQLTSSLDKQQGTPLNPLRVAAHFMLAVVRMVSEYLVASVQKPNLGMQIFIEMICQLDVKKQRRIVYYKDKYNLTV